MLAKIQLKNFKSIKEIDLPFGSLTLLTGLNGSGKSSILQAIGLLKQSMTTEMEVMQYLTHLHLKGEWVQIGKGRDLLFEEAETNEGVLIRIETCTDLSVINEIESEYCEWSGLVKDDDDLIPNQSENPVSGFLFDEYKSFQFIQADRLVPALQYQQADSQNREHGSLGKRGEWTVDFLARNGDKKVSKKRLYPTHALKESDQAFLYSIAPTETLKDVCTAWLQNISPGVRPVAELLDQVEASSLRFRYEGKTSSIARNVSREYRAANVGFGLTYCLPIIVACLSAPENALILLENPEAHLHPRGQFQMGLLLAMCANDGVQIVVETHSDHLLNGIRVAAKQKTISAERVQVHFFERSKETGLTTCVSPRLMNNGRFDDWPEGFFDEWDHALDQLLEE